MAGDDSQHVRTYGREGNHSRECNRDRRYRIVLIGAVAFAGIAFFYTLYRAKTKKQKKWRRLDFPALHRKVSLDRKTVDVPQGVIKKSYNNVCLLFLVLVPATSKQSTFPSLLS